MGKTSKWLKSFFLTGKKDHHHHHHKDKSDKPKEKCDNITPPAPKEKRRWSFRRPTEARKELHHDQSLASTSAHGFLETRIDPERHAVAVAVATAAAADAAVAAAQAAAAMVRMTSSGGKKGNNGRGIGSDGMSEDLDLAATKIQSVFRSYLARKALCALKGLVKLQALVRGHLVRRQATTTLRCMQALVAVQTRARMQRIKMLEEEEGERSKCRTPQRQRSLRNSPQHPRFRHSNDNNNSTEENVKIVEVDTSTSRARHSYSAATPTHPPERPLSSHSRHPKVSPTPSGLTDMSPRTYSGRFDEFSFTTAQSGACSPAMGNCFFKSGSCASDATKSPYAGTSQDYPLFPNYMANTQSSRAKARSQSAPKSRPAEFFERQTSRRRATLEGRNIPRGIKMQRSASQASQASQAGANIAGFQYQYQYPWSVKLDRSNVSLKDSECGSTSTVITNTSYYSSVVAQEVHGIR